MKKTSTNITSIILLLMFLLPLLVKLEHHHKHLISNNKQQSVFNEKCDVCDFEFSVFSTDFEKIDLQADKPIDKYNNNYSSQYFFNLKQFSFLLRAPPC